MTQTTTRRAYFVVAATYLVLCTVSLIIWQSDSVGPQIAGFAFLAFAGIQFLGLIHLHGVGKDLRNATKRFPTVLDVNPSGRPYPFGLSGAGLISAFAATAILPLAAAGFFKAGSLIGGTPILLVLGVAGFLPMLQPIKTTTSDEVTS